MALPLVRIVSTLAPLVMGAFDLYRKRREAKEAERGQTPESMQSPAVLQKKLRELEDADVEQARLVSELSNTVEALATALQRKIDESEQREARLRQLIWAACAIATTGLAVSLWALFR
jgi:hypothetical protein